MSVCVCIHSNLKKKKFKFTHGDFKWPPTCPSNCTSNLHLLLFQNFVRDKMNKCPHMVWKESNECSKEAAWSKIFVSSLRTDQKELNALVAVLKQTATTSLWWWHSVLLSLSVECQHSCQMGKIQLTLQTEKRTGDTGSPTANATLLWFRFHAHYTVTIINTNFLPAAWERKCLYEKEFLQGRSIAPLILNLGPRCRWVISLMPWLLYHQGWSLSVHNEYEAA